MNIEKIQTGNSVNIKLTEKDSVEKMAFEGMKGSSQSFIKDQKDGEYIVSYRPSKNAIVPLEENSLEFSEKNMRVVIYKPNDCGYENAKRMLINENLWGRMN